MDDSSMRHVILYAKHHYKESDRTNDLKIILGERSGMHPIFIHESDIKYVLLKLVYPLIAKRGNPEYAFMDLIKNIEDGSIVDACLSFLKLTEVSHFDFDLGDPDPSILPLKGKE